MTRLRHAPAPLHHDLPWQTDDQRGDGELELRAHRPHAIGFEVYQRGVMALVT
jgi:hypothetical protein